MDRHARGATKRPSGYPDYHDDRNVAISPSAQSDYPDKGHALYRPGRYSSPSRDHTRKSSAEAKARADITTVLKPFLDTKGSDTKPNDLVSVIVSNAASSQLTQLSTLKDDICGFRKEFFRDGSENTFNGISDTTDLFLDLCNISLPSTMQISKDGRLVDRAAHSDGGGDPRASDHRTPATNMAGNDLSGQRRFERDDHGGLGRSGPPQRLGVGQDGSPCIDYRSLELNEGVGDVYGQKFDRNSSRRGGSCLFDAVYDRLNDGNSFSQHGEGLPRLDDGRYGARPRHYDDNHYHDGY